MICLQTLPEHLLYHSISLLYHSSGSSPMEGATVLCLNAISQPTVNICHPRIYISCYYLLGLGLRAVSLGVLDFYRHELSVEKDQVVIMVVHGGVLTAGVLYTSVPSGSKSGVVSKMKNTL